jgi:hypothetical protein
MPNQQPAYDSVILVSIGQESVITHPASMIAPRIASHAATPPAKWDVSYDSIAGADHGGVIRKGLELIGANVLGVALIWEQVWTFIWIITLGIAVGLSLHFAANRLLQKFRE